MKDINIKIYSLIHRVAALCLFIFLSIALISEGKSFLILDPHEKSSPVYFVALKSMLLFAVSLIGPFVIFITFWKIEIRNNQLNISKYFGLLKRQYKQKDINKLIMKDHQKVVNFKEGKYDKSHYPSDLCLIFNDGFKIKIDRTAKNYNLLCDYLNTKK